MTSIGLDQRLVAAARSGDAAAFSALAERHRRELQVHAYRMLGSLEDAQDAVQEAFLRAWKRARRTGGSPLSAPGSTASRPTPASGSSSAGLGASCPTTRFPPPSSAPRRRRSPTFRGCS